jgi:hypothetical protein
VYAKIYESINKDVKTTYNLKPSIHARLNKFVIYMVVRAPSPISISLIPDLFLIGLVSDEFWLLTIRTSSPCLRAIS